jgi:hypothetical protein
VNDDYKQTRTNIHALSGIRTHGLNIQEIKAYASDHVATGTGMVCQIRILLILKLKFCGVNKQRNMLKMSLLVAYLENFLKNGLMYRNNLHKAKYIYCYTS